MKGWTERERARPNAEIEICLIDEPIWPSFDGPSLPAADEGGRGSLAFIVDAYRYGLKGCPIA